MAERRKPHYTVPRQEMVRRNKEIAPFLLENSKGVFLDDMCRIIFQRFGYEYTQLQLQALYRRLHIISGTAGKYRGHHYRLLITSEMSEFIKTHQYDYKNDEMLEHLRKFPKGDKVNRECLVRYRRKHKLTYRKYTPEMHDFVKQWCKEQDNIRYEELAKLMTEKFGKEFKRTDVASFVSWYGYSTKHYKAHRTARQRPLYSERWRRSHQGEAGYWEVKVAEPNVWRPKSNILWEQYHGKKIDDKHTVIYLDGDHNNLTKENLLLVSKRAMGIINSRYKITKGNQELSRLACTLGELDIALYDAQREGED